MTLEVVLSAVGSSQWCPCLKDGHRIYFTVSLDPGELAHTPKRLFPCFLAGTAVTVSTLCGACVGAGGGGADVGANAGGARWCPGSC